MKGATTMKMKKMKKTIGLSALTIPFVALGLVYAATPQKPVAVQAYNSLGAKYFTGHNATAESFTDKPLTNISPGNAGFTTEITPTGGHTNVRVTFNRAINVAGIAENMFAFDKYLSGSETIAVADAIVITYKNVKQPDKVLSIINRVHSGVWNSVTLAFTDKLEVRDGDVYLEGTNQKTVGLVKNTSTYNDVGHIYGNTQKASAPLWGCDYFYTAILDDGSVRHNQWSVYGNILNADFLAASRASLDEASEFYGRYTAAFANDLLTALKDDYNAMEVTYYNIHTAEKLAFRMRQIEAVWLGENANKEPGGGHYPFSLPKLGTDLRPIKLWTGTAYKISDVITPYTALTDYSVWWQGWNDAVVHTDATWITSANQASKPFTPTVAGKAAKGITVYSYANQPPNSWSNVYTYQDIYFDVLSTEAKNWAETFAPSLSCDASGNTAPDKTNWGTQATAFNALTDDAKAAIVNAKYTISGGTVVALGDTIQEVAEAMAKYDYIVAKYGTAEYNAFVTGRVAPVGTVPFDNYSVDLYNNSLIIVLSAMLLASAFAFAYFYAKKKRRQ